MTSRDKMAVASRIVSRLHQNEEESSYDDKLLMSYAREAMLEVVPKERRIILTYPSKHAWIRQLVEQELREGDIQSITEPKPPEPPQHREGVDDLILEALGRLQSTLDLVLDTLTAHDNQLSNIFDQISLRAARKKRRIKHDVTHSERMVRVGIVGIVIGRQKTELAHSLKGLVDVVLIDEDASSFPVDFVVIASWVSPKHHKRIVEICKSQHIPVTRVEGSVTQIKEAALKFSQGVISGGKS